MMRVFALSLALSVLLAMSMSARADVLIGLVVANELAGMNLEFSSKGNSFYAVMGAYQSKTGYEVDNLTGLVGYRRYQGGRNLENGYFGGVFAGDIDGGPDYNRYGAAGELGYQWVTDHLRMSLQAGIGLVGESSRGAEAGGTEIEPLAILGAGISLRF